MHFMLRITIAMLIAGSGMLAILGCEAGDAQVATIEGRAKQLTQTQREAIVAASNHAMRQHVKGPRKKEAPDDIDLANWGEAIAKLKPIRVRNELINVAIVLAQKDGVEEGLYVNLPISSFIPTGYARFDKLTSADDKSFGTLYYYQSKPKAK